MNAFPQDSYPWWTGCGAPGGHPLANIGPTGISALRPAPSDPRPTSGHIHEQSGILPRILLLVDDQLPLLDLGDIESQTALKLGSGPHARVVLSKPDLLRIASNRSDIGSKELIFLPLVVKKGAIVLDYNNQQRVFICYSPEGQPEGFVIEISIEENATSLRCVDLRREDALSFKKFSECNWLVRRQK